jgi:hypothetical protein
MGTEYPIKFYNIPAPNTNRPKLLGFGAVWKDVGAFL